MSGNCPAAGLNNGRSNRKRNTNIHRRARRERREKPTSIKNNSNDLCELRELGGELNYYQKISGNGKILKDGSSL